MTGFLGKAPLISDIGLILEIAVIIILLFGRYRFARRKKFATHGFMMAFAVGLHTVSILLIMIPSLLASLSVFLGNLQMPAVILTWIHVPTGALALILGAYLILKWRFKSASTCYRRAKLMRPVWWLWILSLILGLFIFAAIAFFR